jgi:class III lanthionine synthetase
MRSRPNPLLRLLDKNYYESFNTYTPQKSDFHQMVWSKLAVGHEISRQGIWFYCSLSSNEMPRQGWKIHVSATLRNAREILERVSSILLESGEANFKFALDMKVLGLLNSKSWPRGSAGKFMTIYPPTPGSFLDLIEKIHEATKQFSGPYILSDRRYSTSKVIFYRYGGMQLVEKLNVSGEKTPILVGPDGSEIPDQRSAFPVTPWWAEQVISDDSVPNEAGSNALRDGRYEIVDVLEFSNAGGIYCAVDRETSQKVVIKEARPYINEAADGYDAVDLLKKEFRLLTELEGTGIAPRPVGLFREWEHWFLAEEYVEGALLSKHSAAQSILLRTRPDAKDYEQWYRIFRAICLGLAEIMEILHRHNIVFSDLSANNVIVLAGSLKLKLIDFEGAYRAGIDHPTGLYTPGFVSQGRLSGSVSGEEDDLYSLGAVLYHYLLPVNGLFHLNPEAKWKIMNSIQSDTGLPDLLAKMILDLMHENPSQRPGLRQVIETVSAAPLLKDVPANQHGELTHERTEEYEEVLKGIVTHIENAATYQRRDRLYPSDPRVFSTNPLSLAYGASGIAYALERITGKLPEAAVNWILGQRIANHSYAPGLYVGLSGIAWSLLEVGLTEEAERILKLTFNHPLLHAAPDLFYGMAGWGMTNLRFYLETHDELYLDNARKAGEKLLETATVAGKGWYWKALDELRLGLAHGASGIGLFLLYLYLATDEEEFLAAGQKALDFDLSYGVETPDQGLSWPSMAEVRSPLYPYLRYGSAGIGTAVIRFDEVLHLEKYRTVLKKIVIDTDRKYAVFPGRFIGLAGVGDFLLDMYRFRGEERYLESAVKVAEGIMNFQVQHNGTAFPGDMLSRLCCDYGTGSAGIGLFLNRLVGRQQSDFMLDALLMFPAVRQVRTQNTARMYHVPFTDRDNKAYEITCERILGESESGNSSCSKVMRAVA